MNVLLFFTSFLVASTPHALSFLEPNAECDRRPGLADSSILALSWEPAFCEVYGYHAGLLECLRLVSTDPAASHFSLHGLWPNQASCGKDYTFCTSKPLASACDYPPVVLQPETVLALKEVLPSFAAGTCLERYEWSKHGTCQLLAMDNYFELAIRLTKEANQSSFGQFFHNNRGKKVTQSQLSAAVREAFGEGADKKIQVICRGVITEIRIQLPATIQEESLVDLIQKAQTIFHPYVGCTDPMKVSDFTSEVFDNRPTYP